MRYVTHLDAEAPTPVSLSVRKSEGHTFGFPFCQRLWDLTKRQDDIALADMAAKMEVHMLTDMFKNKFIKPEMF